MSIQTECILPKLSNLVFPFPKRFLERFIGRKAISYLSALRSRLIAIPSRACGR